MRSSLPFACLERTMRNRILAREHRIVSMGIEQRLGKLGLPLHAERPRDQTEIDHGCR